MDNKQPSQDYDLEYLTKYPLNEKLNECYFITGKKTSSATICVNCGKEKMFHTIGEGIIGNEQPSQDYDLAYLTKYPNDVKLNELEDYIKNDNIDISLSLNYFIGYQDCRNKILTKIKSLKS